MVDRGTPNPKRSRADAGETSRHATATGEWIGTRVDLSGIWPQVYQAYLQAKNLPEMGTQEGSRKTRQKCRIIPGTGAITPPCSSPVIPAWPRRLQVSRSHEPNSRMYTCPWRRLPLPGKSVAGHGDGRLGEFVASPDSRTTFKDRYSSYKGCTATSASCAAVQYGAPVRLTRVFQLSRLQGQVSNRLQAVAESHVAFGGANCFHGIAGRLNCLCYLASSIGFVAHHWHLERDQMAPEAESPIPASTV